MRNQWKSLAVILLIGGLSGCTDHELTNNVVSQSGLALSPLQEVPQKNSPATGTATVSYDKTTRMLTYTLTWKDLTGNPVGSHIHGPAPRGTNAGILHDFTAPLPKTTSGTFTNSVRVDGVNLKEEDLLNGLYYFNIHTPANPGGEIRGQIEFYDQPFMVVKKGLPVEGSQEVPPRTTPATGSVDVIYNKNTKRLSYFITWKDLTGNPVGSHIHGTAPRGVNAGVQHDFTALLPAATSGAVSNSVLVDEVKIKEMELLNGLYYFNIHTPTYPGGEIRGQIEF
ncbi:CHRD domain-containing protein [Telluribacter sp. SYSU D00476]|uniref:CHRD domain-containing protein n=1 Tax=Telluribacter sp. SYSU D00476 TaxID=2811430 RepID=UPI001FF6E210|nr:CHRD domain-containing protein [Telluribacter sp. SYSU D00476]